MPITTLHIANFRNLTAVTLDPCSVGLNIIYGNNGSGKTSLLEAIYYLGRGRSFRSQTIAPVIKQASNKFSIYTQVVTDEERYLTVGLERTLQGSMRMRLGEQDAKTIAELAHLLPIRLMNVQSHHLVESGPIFRKKYLDWGVFYQSESFFSYWRHFERVLKQRNSLLRQKRLKKELDVWTEALVCSGMVLDKLRRDYLGLLIPVVRETAQALLTLPTIDIRYYPGWDETKDYMSALASSYQNEYRLGYTLFGPHRADLILSIDGVLVRDLLSRGQQKLLVYAMLLAQGTLLARYSHKGVIYLIDDLPSELDVQGRKRLFSLVSKQQNQAFITAIDPHVVCEEVNEASPIPIKMFHVEQGSIIEGH